MLFVIHCLDAKDSGNARKQHYPAHDEFLKNHTKYGAQIVMSGPLLADDGATPAGSHFIIEASDLNAAKAFHHADPFHGAGVWVESSVMPFIKRVG